MPALPLAPSIYQVSTIGTLHGKPCDHVVNWYVPSPIGAIDNIAITLANEDVAQFMANFATYFSPAYVHVRTDVKYLGDLAHITRTAVSGAAGADIFGNRVPAFACVTIRHKAPTRGKGLDGRTNFPGPEDSHVSATDGYSLDATTVTDLTNRWATYVGLVSGAVLGANPTATAAEVCILHRHTGLASIPVSSTCDPVLNTHRRWAKHLARH